MIDRAQGNSVDSAKSSVVEDLIGIGFPSIFYNGKYYTQDMSTIVPSEMYTKQFQEEFLLDEMERYVTGIHNCQNLCHSEAFMIMQMAIYEYIQEKLIKRGNDQDK